MNQFMSKNDGLVLNGDGIIVPGGIDVSAMHEKGISHLHSCVLVTRHNIRSGALEVLLQQRGFDKAQYPGRWCFSAAGHCNETDFERSTVSGVSPDLEGLKRETAEELSLNFLKLSADGENSLIEDATGIARAPEFGHLMRLIRSPQTPKIDGAQPFEENPILTVGWFHVLNDLAVRPKSSEVAAMEWVAASQLNEINLTPWLRYFLRFVPDVTSGKIGRQYHHGQILRGPHVAQSTFGAILGTDRAMA